MCNCLEKDLTPGKELSNKTIHFKTVNEDIDIQTNSDQKRQCTSF